MCVVRAVSHQDGAVTEVALFPQCPQLLHQLAAVVRQLYHCLMPRRWEVFPSVRTEHLVRLENENLGNNFQQLTKVLRLKYVCNL